MISPRFVNLNTYLKPVAKPLESLVVGACVSEGDSCLDGVNHPLDAPAIPRSHGQRGVIQGGSGMALLGGMGEQEELGPC